ncbi:uncharacterized protein LOC142351421 [Convolutriloba macropyga]|uniref:uncharacterized protein LOC142351421 n=1 Tax=Convolutriloba macropyga TaxID=536237 RepID=UPI003F51B563
MCDCCTVGITFSAVGIGLCCYTLLFVTLGFITFGTFSLYSHEYMSGTNGDLVKAGLAFHVITVFITIGCVVTWSILCCAKKYDGRTPPLVANLVLHICGEACIILAASLVTAAASILDASTAYAGLLWWSTILYSSSFAIACVIFACADRNTQPCCRDCC